MDVQKSLMEPQHKISPISYLFIVNWPVSSPKWLTKLMTPSTTTSATNLSPDSIKKEAFSLEWTLNRRPTWTHSLCLLCFWNEEVYSYNHPPTCPPHAPSHHSSTFPYDSSLSRCITSVLLSESLTLQINEHSLTQHPLPATITFPYTLPTQNYR